MTLGANATIRGVECIPPARTMARVCIWLVMTFMTHAWTMCNATASTKQLIIGAGAGSTGTHSLYNWLCEMGFTAVHWSKTCGQISETGVVYEWANNHTNPLIDLEPSGRDAFDYTLFDGADAVSEYPFPSYFSYLLRDHPDAYVILTVRNATEWVHKREHDHPTTPMVGLSEEASMRAIETRAASDKRARPSTRRMEDSVAAYERHNALVRKLAPPSRLLEMNVFDEPDVVLKRRLREFLKGIPRTNGCDLCAEDWVIVIANGRSGSTTIVDMLNTLGGVYVAGELEPKLKQLHDLMRKSLEREHSTSGPFQTRHMVDRHAVYCAAQNVLKAAMGGLDSGLRLIGFKLLHGPEAHWKKTSSFLQSIFPCARFVVNWRNGIKAEFKSKPFFARQTTVEGLGQRKKNLQHFANKNPAIAFPLPLEVLCLPAYL